MNWKKRGLIYNADGEKWWKIHSAMLPTALKLDDRIRIYLGHCDENGVGRIGYIDVAKDNPAIILSISDKPVLDIGRPGCFDDNGVVPISIIKREKEIYLYYVGFQLGVKVPYFMFGGLAISCDGGKTFDRYSESPILDRIGGEVYARCGINVIYDEGRYKMWYIGSHNEGWTEHNCKMKPLYVMKYVESEDGIHWNNESVQCMRYANSDEHGFGRPFVWREESILKMYYSIRTYSRGYYIGYAESNDGVTWIRKDSEAGIELGPGLWEDRNICYPFLIDCEDKKYMFYNGNDCGKTGFGFAELI